MVETGYLEGFALHTLPLVVALLVLTRFPTAELHVFQAYEPMLGIHIPIYKI